MFIVKGMKVQVCPTYLGDAVAPQGLRNPVHRLKEFV